MTSDWICHSHVIFGFPPISATGFYEDRKYVMAKAGVDRQEKMILELNKSFRKNGIRFYNKIL